MVKSLNLSKIHLKTSLLSFIKRIWPFYELNHPSPGFIVFGDKKTRKSFKFSAVFDVPIFWNIACALFVCFRVFFHWCGYLRHMVISLWCYNSVISAYSVSSPLMNTMRSHLRISKWFSITVLVQTTEVASRIRCNVRHTQYFKFRRERNIYVLTTYQNTEVVDLFGLDFWASSNSPKGKTIKSGKCRKMSPCEADCTLARLKPLTQIRDRFAS